MDFPITQVILIVLGIISLSFFLFEKIKAYSLKATLIKTLTSILFIATAITSSYHWITTTYYPLGFFIIGGLVFGLLGDIFLDFKYVFPNENRPFTYAGFIVFLIGHIIYISGLFYTYSSLTTVNSFIPIIVAVGIGLILGTITVVLEKPLKLKYGEFKLIVFIYATSLFTTLGSALSLYIFTNFFSNQLLLMSIGGAFFAISDLILSGTYFGENKERPVDIITNAVTYYTAQFLIAFSLSFL